MTASATRSPYRADDASEFLLLDAAVYGHPTGAMKRAPTTRLDGSSSLKPWAIALMFPLSIGTIGALAALGGAEEIRSGLSRGVLIGAPSAPFRRRNDSEPLATGTFPATVEVWSETAPSAEHSSEQVEVAQDAITAKDQVAAIQASLSLSVTEVADVLGVARGTVHGWLKDTVPVPRMQADAQRLRELHQVAVRWRERTPETLGRLVVAPVGEAGASLLALLKAERWDQIEIQRTIGILADRLDAQAVEQRKSRERGIGLPRSITAETIELERLRLRGLG